MSDLIAELVAAGSAPGESYAQVQRDQRQRVEDYKENTARLATSSIRYVTTGSGQTAPRSPVMFDCVFTVEPAVTSGMFVSKLPDSSHYLYPQVTAGVREWVTHENPADHKKDKNDPSRRPLYVGAYLFFVVIAQPLRLPRTDGSNKAQLMTATIAANQDVVNTAPGTADHTAAVSKVKTLNALIQEASEALYLKAHPAQVVITHHMTFQQTAIKGLPENVTSDLDSSIAAIPALYGVSQS